MLVLVDPHRDLAVAALGLVPRERQADVVYLDVSNRRRPFGINLLDVGLGWDRDQATANALRIFRREFDGFWGPRMEDAFRFAVLALFEANEAHVRRRPARWAAVPSTPSWTCRRCSSARLSPPGPEAHARPGHPPVVRRLFRRRSNRGYQLEIINPVQTKVHKYLGSRVARQIVGQPRSTIDFRQLVAEHNW